GEELFSDGATSLIYAFVARGTVILADYTEFTGNFTGIALSVSRNFLLQTTSSLTTVMATLSTISSIAASLIVWLLLNLLADRFLWHFLRELKRILPRYGGGKAVAPANSLSQGVWFLEDLSLLGGSYSCTHMYIYTGYVRHKPKLKEHMQYCIDHPEEISKIAKVKAQVSEVKGVMMEILRRFWTVARKLSFCTRFPAAGNPDEEKDVVSKHEDKADSYWNPDRFDSHHCTVRLPWLQMHLTNCLSTLNSTAVSYIAIAAVTSNV
ncbi:putative vesicle-associated membrane protein 726, partial [Hibiscus syriacus]|uniref:putative vesicle-associated membrane protein 726 n=1 Tax=Hibiscus syriacus TaxID=106335 RepID=UPI001922C437